MKAIFPQAAGKTWLLMLSNARPCGLCVSRCFVALFFESGIQMFPEHLKYYIVYYCIIFYYFYIMLY